MLWSKSGKSVILAVGREYAFVELSNREKGQDSWLTICPFGAARTNPVIIAIEDNIALLLKDSKRGIGIKIFICLLKSLI